MSTINDALTSIQKTRTTLATLIVLVVTLSQRITAIRDQHKVVQDEVIAEIWANPDYKNDKQRNEQKHLAAINDERLTKPLDAIAALEIERAQAQADTLVAQNVLTIATAQYQNMLTASPFAGMQLVMAITEVMDVDGIKKLELVQTHETATPAGTPADISTTAPAAAETSTGSAVDESSSPVDAWPKVMPEGNGFMAVGAKFTDIQSSHDYAFGDTEAEARTNYEAQFASSSDVAAE